MLDAETMFEEKNTGTNLPAQIELYGTKGNEYKFMFIAKGGGSANKTFLYQQTKVREPREAGSRIGAGVGVRVGQGEGEQGREDGWRGEVAATAATYAAQHNQRSHIGPG